MKIYATAIASAVFAFALAAPAASAAEGSPASMASPAAHHAFFGHRKGLPGLPRKWDRRIPLPEGAAVKDVKPPAGAAQAVEFAAPGDFDQTIAFYKEALPRAGFQLGPEVKVPARKAYSLNFMRAGVQDTLAIFPDKSDPSKLGMRIIYTPEKGWIHTKLAKWEDRARLLPKWWRHREEEKREQKENAKESPTAPAHVR